MTPSEAARCYAADYGWLPVPVRPDTKRPMVSWKPEAIPLDADPLASYERFRGYYQRPGTLVGVLTGARSGGLVVVDIDPGGQRPSLDECPPTLADTTPRGGTHLYYVARPGRKIKTKASWRPGVDVRGEGGLVVVPPGPGRQWIPDGPHAPAPAPPCLPEHRPQRRKPRRPPTGLKLDAFVRISLHAACKKVRQAPDGTRNTTLNTQAYYAFLDLVPQGADEDIIAEELRDAAHETGLDEEETERTIESARSDAAAKRERGPQ